MRLILTLHVEAHVQGPYCHNVLQVNSYVLMALLIIEASHEYDVLLS